MFVDLWKKTYEDKEDFLSRMKKTNKKIQESVKMFDYYEYYRSWKISFLDCDKIKYTENRSY